MNQMLHRPTSQGSAMNTGSWGFLVRRFYTPAVTEVSQVAITFVCSPMGLGARLLRHSFLVSLAPVRLSLQCTFSHRLLIFFETCNQRCYSSGATQVNPGAKVTDPESACEQVIFSGGGFSNVFAVPEYQKEAQADFFAKHPPPYTSTQFNNSQTVGLFHVPTVLLELTDCPLLPGPRLS